MKPGTSLRLRLINHSAYFSYWFSIESHNLTIVEIDGVEVEPIISSGVHINIGQRYSVIVDMDQNVGDYAIRQTLERECFLPFATYNSSGLEDMQYEARGILRYEGFQGFEGILSPPPGKRAEEEQAGGISTTTEDVTNPNPYGCKDLPFDQPVPKRAEKAYTLAKGDPEHVLDFQFRQAGEINRIFINRTSWAPLLDDALLWQASEQDFTTVGGGGGYNNWGFRLDQQVLLIPDASQTVQVVLNSLDVMEHPFHMQYVLPSLPFNSEPS